MPSPAYLCLHFWDSSPPFPSLVSQSPRKNTYEQQQHTDPSPCSSRDKVVEDCRFSKCAFSSVGLAVVGLCGERGEEKRNRQHMSSFHPGSAQTNPYSSNNSIISISSADAHALIEFDLAAVKSARQLVRNPIPRTSLLSSDDGECALAVPGRSPSRRRLAFVRSALLRRMTWTRDKAQQSTDGKADGPSNTQRRLPDSARVLRANLPDPDPDPDPPDRSSPATERRRRHKGQVKRFRQRQRNQEARSKADSRDDDLFLFQWSPGAGRSGLHKAVNEAAPLSPLPPLQGPGHCTGLRSAPSSPGPGSPSSSFPPCRELMLRPPSTSRTCLHCEGALPPLSGDPYQSMDQQLVCSCYVASLPIPIRNPPTCDSRESSGATAPPAGGPATPSSSSALPISMAVRRVGEETRPLPMPLPLPPGMDIGRPPANFLSMEQQFRTFQHAPGFHRNACAALFALTQVALHDGTETESSTAASPSAAAEPSGLQLQPVPSAAMNSVRIPKRRRHQRPPQARLVLRIRRVSPSVLLLYGATDHLAMTRVSTPETLRYKSLIAKTLYHLLAAAEAQRAPPDTPQREGPLAAPQTPPGGGGGAHQVHTLPLLLGDAPASMPPPPPPGYWRSGRALLVPGASPYTAEWWYTATQGMCPAAAAAAAAHPAGAGRSLVLPVERPRLHTYSRVLAFDVGGVAEKFTVYTGVEAPVIYDEATGAEALLHLSEESEAALMAPPAAPAARLALTAGSTYCASATAASPPPPAEVLCDRSREALVPAVPSKSPTLPSSVSPGRGGVASAEDPFQLWFEAFCAGAPLIGQYVHHGGVVQGYRRIRVSDLQLALDQDELQAAFAYTAMVLEFLKQSCIEGGCEYTLAQHGGELRLSRSSLLMPSSPHPPVSPSYEAPSTPASAAPSEKTKSFSGQGSPSPQSAHPKRRDETRPTTTGAVTALPTGTSTIEAVPLHINGCHPCTSLISPAAVVLQQVREALQDVVAAWWRRDAAVPSGRNEAREGRRRCPREEAAAGDSPHGMTNPSLLHRLLGGLLLLERHCQGPFSSRSGPAAVAGTTCAHEEALRRATAQAFGDVSLVLLYAQAHNLRRQLGLWMEAIRGVETEVQRSACLCSSNDLLGKGAYASRGGLPRTAAEQHDSSNGGKAHEESIGFDFSTLRWLQSLSGSGAGRAPPSTGLTALRLYRLLLPPKGSHAPLPQLPRPLRNTPACPRQDVVCISALSQGQVYHQLGWWRWRNGQIFHAVEALQQAALLLREQKNALDRTACGAEAAEEDTLLPLAPPLLLTPPWAVATDLSAVLIALGHAAWRREEEGARPGCRTPTAAETEPISPSGHRNDSSEVYRDRALRALAEAGAHHRWGRDHHGNTFIAAQRKQRMESSLSSLDRGGGGCEAAPEICPENDITAYASLICAQLWSSLSLLEVGPGAPASLPLLLEFVQWGIRRTHDGSNAQWCRRFTVEPCVVLCGLWWGVAKRMAVAVEQPPREGDTSAVLLLLVPPSQLVVDTDVENVSRLRASYWALLDVLLSSTAAGSSSPTAALAGCWCRLTRLLGSLVDAVLEAAECEGKESCGAVERFSLSLGMWTSPSATAASCTTLQRSGSDVCQADGLDGRQGTLNFVCRCRDAVKAMVSSPMEEELCVCGMERRLKALEQLLSGLQYEYRAVPPTEGKAREL
eukprot:gene9560-6716_t